MANHPVFSWVLAAVCLAPLWVQAGWQGLDTRDIDIDVVGDRSGHSLRQYPVEERDRTYRGYLAARPGAEYSIRVGNRTGRRVGVVISVDGRNIVSGEHSDLGPDERMYVLGPYQRAEYSGWRTGQNQVNRFYFTDAPDSSAGRWGDYSAVGVIAVAAYAERRPTYYDEHLGHRRAPSGVPEDRPGAIAPRHRVAPAQPGTGFGDEEWSPSRRVAFDAERKPFARYFIKYEWARNLCHMGISDCRGGGDGRYPGRWRDDDRFAPSPPGIDDWRRRH